MRKRLHNIIKETKESSDARKKAVEGIDRARMEGASSAIAAKIRRRLRMLGMSNADFAKAIGTYAPTVTKWLSGTHNFELKTLVDIEDVLDIAIIDRNVIPLKSLTDAFIGDSSDQLNSDRHNTNIVLTVVYNRAANIPESEFIEYDYKLQMNNE